jgi:hypothetical protein
LGGGCGTRPSEGVCEERVPCVLVAGGCAPMLGWCSTPCVIFCAVSSGSTAPRVAHGYERPASVCMCVCVCVCHREILATARLFAGALGDCWDWVRVRIA